MADHDPAPEPPTGWPTRLWERHGSGLEFDRLAFFTDAVFAIAVTLVAIEIGVPDITPSGDAGALWTAVRDDVPAIIAFFLAFGIVASYWLANHRFMASLRGATPGFAGLTMLYLATVAFLPYPAALFGRYSGNATAIALLAVSASAVSAMEAALFYAASRAGLFSAPVSARIVRWALIGSLTPVAFFLASIPVALLVHPLAGVAVWFASPVAGLLESARAPQEVRPPGRARRTR